MPSYTNHISKFTSVLAADNHEIISGFTVTQIKTMSFIKRSNELFIEAEIKHFEAPGVSLVECLVRHDNLETNDLVLIHNSPVFKIVAGSIDISSFSAGRHTLEFYMVGSATQVSLRETWVYEKDK